MEVNLLSVVTPSNLFNTVFLFKIWICHFDLESTGDLREARPRVWNFFGLALSEFLETIQESFAGRR